LESLDHGLRRGDDMGRISTFYEAVKIDGLVKSSS
jgi:hypothetical protein